MLTVTGNSLSSLCLVVCGANESSGNKKLHPIADRAFSEIKITWRWPGYRRRSVTKHMEQFQNAFAGQTLCLRGDDRLEDIPAHTRSLILPCSLSQHPGLSCASARFNLLTVELQL